MQVQRVAGISVLGNPTTKGYKRGGDPFGKRLCVTGGGVVVSMLLLGHNQDRGPDKEYMC